MLKLTALIAGAALAAAHTRNTFNAEEFILVGRAAGDAPMVFSAALPARNADKLDAILMDISDPKRYVVPGVFMRNIPRKLDIWSPVAAHLCVLSHFNHACSPNYGNWLSQQEVNDLTAPEAAIREEVHSWYVPSQKMCFAAKFSSERHPSFFPPPAG
jgi:hypothetical protein